MLYREVDHMLYKINLLLSVIEKKKLVFTPIGNEDATKINN